MELFGIVFSVPVALVASAIYAIFLSAVVKRFEYLTMLFRAGSVLVLALFVVEVVLLSTLGAIQSRGVFGPAFYYAHLAVFFFGTPALANILVLRKRVGLFGHWYAVAPVCALFALVLVLLQYGVSEALFGVDGMSGPYSD